MSIAIGRDASGRLHLSVTNDDHEHWNDGWDQCGTCGAQVLPDGEQVAKNYAVEREDGWHIAVWDGECFAVTSSWQSGDRWLPTDLLQFLVLPASAATIDNARRDT
jgi:hypothetical protein